MKYSLRSLMIVVLVAPPLMAGAWFCWQRFKPEEIVPYQAIDTGLMPMDEPPNSQAPATNPTKK